MITYKDLQEKGICWTGYKRKKGTKPYEDNSCMKEELEKHHVLAFGRMNPITSGHEAVVNKLHSVAKEHSASHSLVVSHSQDAKKNPLTGEQKVAHAKNAFPGTKVSSASKESPTILHHAAAAHAAGATHLHVVAGSDRHEEMHNLLHKYNGKDSGHGHYNFKKITVHSSGERDPDAEGTTGMSASKMREHAASGNKAEFHKGAPSNMKPEHKDAMYNDVRKGMNIKEELRSEMGAAAYINDFIKSTNPRFNNKSKEERRKMAIGAFMAAKSRLKEQVQIDELSNDLLSKYKTAAGADAKAADAAGNYAKGDKRFKGINKATNKQFDNDLKKHGQMKEGTLQGNIGGGDAMNTTTSAPSASTSKDTTMGKKIKGFKFFNGENDKQMNMNQPVKEEIQIDELSKSTLSSYASKAADSARTMPGYGTKDEGSKKTKRMANIAAALGRKNTTTVKENHPVAPGLDKKYIKGTPENKAAKAASKPINGHPTNVKEAVYQNKTTGETFGSASKPADKPTAPAAPSRKQSALEKVRARMDASKTVKEGMSRQDRERSAEEQARRERVLQTNPRIAAEVERRRKAAEAAKAEKSSVKEEVLDEKSEQAKQNKTMKNMMDASRGARFKINNPQSMTPKPDAGHKTPRDHNVAIGRALRNEEALDEMKTGNPGHGYHGQHQTTHNADDAYKNTHAHVKSLTDADDKTVKHYLDSAHGRHLVGREQDHDYVKKDFKKFQKHYRPEMHEAVASKAVNVDKVNHAGDAPHEEKWEPAPKKVSKLKKEETMKSYKEFLQSLDEIKMSELPSRKIQGRSYGADYSDPEGADETAADMKKPAKAAGRKAGQSTGSYKPRKTMSKLKAAGATYK